ncbi:hypothetical protein HJD18_12205 [Thermoleophilia bacterium SCSIO 60948]|nr:hypothetical protein HJD18_12205 [Thermoleophilia bacterium SCSIO 60948]
MSESYDAVDEALVAYARAHAEDPSTDPVPYLERVPADQQPLLEQLLDAYLAHAPSPAFDRERFESSWVRDAVDRFYADTQTRPVEGWRSLLPRLRDRAELTRERLVAELAKALNAPERVEKVSVYYHEMEQERLDPDGVSDRVFDALGALLSESAETIRAAGRRIAPPASPGTAPTFARTATPDPQYEYDALVTPAAASATPDDEWDEVDELFRGAAPDTGEARPPE